MRDDESWSEMRMSCFALGGLGVRGVARCVLIIIVEVDGTSYVSQNGVSHVKKSQITKHKIQNLCTISSLC